MCALQPYEERFMVFNDTSVCGALHRMPKTKQNKRKIDKLSTHLHTNVEACNLQYTYEYMVRMMLNLLEPKQ